MQSINGSGTEAETWSIIGYPLSLWLDDIDFFANQIHGWHQAGG